MRRWHKRSLPGLQDKLAALLYGTARPATE